MGIISPLAGIGRGAKSAATVVKKVAKSYVKGAKQTARTGRAVAKKGGSVKAAMGQGIKRSLKTKSKRTYGAVNAAAGAAVGHAMSRKKKKK